MIEKKIIEKITKKVGEQFPEFKGVKPEVNEKKIPPQKEVYKKLSLEVSRETRTVFNFRFVKKVRMADNIKMNKILIVTTDKFGQIIKISQSK